jgi:hypothetical protein
MSIDKHCGHDDEMNDAPGSQAGSHARIALEQSALYAARLAIARWINSSSDATRATFMPASELPQANWYAQAQQNFQEWLGRGGFAQYDVPCAEQAVTVVVPYDKSIARLTNGKTRRSNTCFD